MFCPCGSKELFADCCSPLINELVAANSPETLMRSRYCAYAIKDAQYLYKTYAQSTRTSQSIEEIQAWADETIWVSLSIKAADADHSVLFTACYIQGNKQFQLTERSRFILENQRWHYLDGDIIEHLEVATLTRNQPCPCQSNKKFKQCCGR